MSLYPWNHKTGDKESVWGDPLDNGDDYKEIQWNLSSTAQIAAGNAGDIYSFCDQKNNQDTESTRTEYPLQQYLVKPKCKSKVREGVYACYFDPWHGSAGEKKEETYTTNTQQSIMSEDDDSSGNES